MAAYLIASYDVTDPDGFGNYPQAAMQTLSAHGAEVLVAGTDGESLEGQPRKHTVVVKFQSKDAARTWYESEEYVKVKPLRTDNSEGTLVLADELQIPG